MIKILIFSRNTLPKRGSNRRALISHFLQTIRYYFAINWIPWLLFARDMWFAGF